MAYSNQTEWNILLALPNQPNRVWQYYSSYLFTGHLSPLYLCHAIWGPSYDRMVQTGEWSIAQNSTCWDNVTVSEHESVGSSEINNPNYHCTSQSNSTWYGGAEYSCYPTYSARVQYYFNATSATLNG